MKVLKLFSFMLLIGLWSCGPQISSSLPKEGMARYHSYAWVESEQTPKNPLYRGEIIDQNIRKAVDRELQMRGFRVDTEHPDFLVKYHTYTEQKMSSTGGYNGGWPYMGFGRGLYSSGMGYGLGSMGMYGSSPSITTSTQGYLVIDVIDRSSNQTVWRGYAEGNVDNANRISTKIEKGVHSIMKKLPVNGKS